MSRRRGKTPLLYRVVCELGIRPHLSFCDGQQQQQTSSSCFATTTYRNMLSCRRVAGVDGGATVTYLRHIHARLSRVFALQEVSCVLQLVSYRLVQFVQQYIHSGSPDSEFGDLEVLPNSPEILSDSYYFLFSLFFVHRLHIIFSWTYIIYHTRICTRT